MADTSRGAQAPTCGDEMAAPVSLYSDWAAYRIAVWRDLGVALGMDRLEGGRDASPRSANVAGCPQEDAARKDGKPTNPADETLAQDGWRDWPSDPLQGPASDAPAKDVADGREGCRADGGDAAHATAHSRDMDDARGRPCVGGGGSPRNDAVDPGNRLRQAPPRLPEGSRRSLISGRFCARLVGVAGFEPATPSSRTRYTPAKLLILLASKWRKYVNETGNDKHFCSISGQEVQ
jgi:hypothetical protein